MKRPVGIMILLVLVIMGTISGVGLRNSFRKDIARSTPAPDPLLAVRHITARTIENGLKETGCPKCSAYASGGTLRISHPDLAPRAVASALFANKKTVEALKKAGFTKVSIDQGDRAFEYKIE